MSYHEKATKINGDLKRVGFDTSNVDDHTKKEVINSMLYYAKVCVRSGRHPTSFRNISEAVFKDIAELKMVEIEANERRFPILQVSKIC